MMMQHRVSFSCLAACLLILVFGSNSQAAGVSNLKVEFFDSISQLFFNATDADGNTTDGSFSLAGSVGFGGYPKMRAIDPSKPIATATGNGAKANIKLTNLEIDVPLPTLATFASVRVVADWMHDAGPVTVSAMADGSVISPLAEEISDISLTAGFEGLELTDGTQVMGTGMFDLNPSQTTGSLPMPAVTQISSTFTVVLPPGGKVLLPDSLDISFAIVPEPASAALVGLAMALCACRGRRLHS